MDQQSNFFYLLLLLSICALNFFFDKIIFYLPSVTDAPESLDCQTNLVSHFNTIKVNEYLEN
jgi:hypothetical protein